MRESERENERQERKREKEERTRESARERARAREKGRIAAVSNGHLTCSWIRVCPSTVWIEINI